MKIAALEDIHLATGRFSQINHGAQKDLHILNGDRTRFGGRDVVRPVPLICKDGCKNVASAILMTGPKDSTHVHANPTSAGRVW